MQGAIRLCYRDGFDPEKAIAGARRIVVEAAEAADFAALEKKMEDAAAAVRAYFPDLVEVPAAAAAKLAPHVDRLARAEGFPVHAESAMIRGARSEGASSPDSGANRTKRDH